MNPRLTFLTFLTFLFSATLQAQTFDLSPFASGFSAPLNIQHAGDERLFIVEQGGRIKILNPDGSVNTSPFLNLSGSISSGGERGLLGLAFHPDYANNGYFFVNYTDPNGDTQISRFSVDALDPDFADPNSELPILSIGQPYGNHNGGCIAFGPDGYLYIGMGDGGSGGDPQNFSQNNSSLLGKMLRLDIDNPSGGQNYGIPPDNPFFGSTTEAQEIWAYGLRNPWKFTFDRDNGDLWIADVGQNAYEEINRVAYTEAGINYGWRCYEGNATYNTNNCADPSTMEFPIAVYPHNVGSSITGGYVYRGSLSSPLVGHYLFADFVSGYMGVLEGTSGELVYQENFGENWASFGEDINGELYVCAFNGIVYKIEPEVVLNVNQFSLNQQLSPNPANNHVVLKSDYLTSYMIFDLSGKLIEEKITQDNKVTIDTQSWPSGLYLIKTNHEQGLQKIGKILIQH